MEVKIRPMAPEDLTAVVEIEQEVSYQPWSINQFQYEITVNQIARIWWPVAAISLWAMPGYG